ncbi:MAG: 16S rRNA (cytidine(1402)-2'-O)-methyltransferase [Gammaproteobacteria bacterium]
MSQTHAPVAPGHLYVVATPIGNLGDLSPRAQAVLGAVDRVCAEDTRTSGALLSHYGLRPRLMALHEHNETRLCAQLVEALRAGESLALISDAGTPLISDPGFALVRAARAAGLPVITLPGPCAAVAALSVSGIATDSFLFCGFLPSKAGARRQRLESLRAQPCTLVFYEASHRILDSLQAMCEVFGPDRVGCLARELTKLYEQSHTAPLEALCRWLAEDPNRSRGEFVLVVAGAPEETPQAAQTARVLEILLRELSPSRAARIAAELTGAPRKLLYEQALLLSAAEESDDEKMP